MRVLLDTHVVLWWLTNDKRLDGDVKELINHEPDVYLSSASVWEIAVKSAQGGFSSRRDLPELMLAAGLPLLDITARHGIAAGRLPLIHNDPFDRVLIAQAITEGLVLATHDRDVQRYDVEVLRV